MPLRASRSLGSSSTRLKFSPTSSQASRLKASDSGVRALVTYVSKAWASASIPVRAVTRGGCDTVNLGSRIAMRNEAFLSPQAILTCVLASEIRANDWVSLPVPAVVGTAIVGSIGRVALPMPQ